jgi:hypothetical protein
MLQTADLFAAVEVSMESLKQQLELVHALVKKATEAKVQLKEAASKEPTKFSTFKAAGGTIDDFFKGLEDRIGEPFNIFDTRMLPCDTIMFNTFLRFDRRSESRLEKSDARGAHNARRKHFHIHDRQLQHNHPTIQRMVVRRR